MKRPIYWIISFLALSGCATAPNPQLMARANRPVYCTGKEDCDVKWSRTMQWVKQNSSYKFDQVSDMIISTKGPLPDDPRSAYTITKIAKGQGRYDIDFSAGCDNIFGCFPSVLEDQANFIDFVMQK